MISIQIEPADNGLLKLLFDDNVNGGGEEYTTRTVYDFEGIVGKQNQVKFLKELVLDLGLVTGNELESNCLRINTEWGTQYTPNDTELKNKIVILAKELKRLQSMLKK
tara:strand:- start:3602 stop:3925 length:324 start_codon:yes stop_codon:yes gene_type:complete